MKTCDASVHPLAACDDPVVGPTSAPPPLTRWQRFDAAALLMDSKCAIGRHGTILPLRYTACP